MAEHDCQSSSEVERTADQLQAVTAHQLVDRSELQQGRAARCSLV
jgi:hypothetical protein